MTAEPTVQLAGLPAASAGARLVPYAKKATEVSQQLLPGFAAGLCGDVAAHPVSMVKTRLQVQGSGGGSHGVTVYRGVGHAFVHILRNEGPMQFFRGFGAVACGSAPAQGLYFGTYEVAKKFFGNGQSSAGTFVAALCSQAAGSLVWVPVDIIKERQQVAAQLKSANAPSGSFGTMVGILHAEGPIGLYRAFPMHMATWGPFQGIYFLIYEKFKLRCLDAGYTDGHGGMAPAAQLGCGVVAGIVASAASNPMDVIKTRRQVARENPAMFPYTTSLGAARHLLQHEGALAFMDGALARVAWMTPRMTICVATYERIKRWMA